MVAADACLESGLCLAELSQPTLEKVAERMPAWATVGNPVDVEPLSETVGSVEAYRIALEAALSDESVDLCLFIMGTIRMPEVSLDFLRNIRQAHPEKPIAVCIVGIQETYEQLFTMAEEMGVPVFPSVRRAAYGLAALYRYTQLRR